MPNSCQAQAADDQSQRSTANPAHAQRLQQRWSRRHRLLALEPAQQALQLVDRARLVDPRFGVRARQNGGLVVALLLLLVLLVLLLLLLALLALLVVALLLVHHHLLLRHLFLVVT